VKVEQLAPIRDQHHLLDVREDEEWVAGHIAGSQHIPLGQLASRLDEVPRDRTVVTICRSGHRSGIAAKGLAARGISAENLDGGVIDWVRSGQPLVTPAGDRGRVL
jgi:rhodanese-related sulfurtransferase